jgi:hypothetical protein
MRVRSLTRHSRSRLGNDLLEGIVFYRINDFSDAIAAQVGGIIDVAYRQDDHSVSIRKGFVCRQGTDFARHHPLHFHLHSRRKVIIKKSHNLITDIRYMSDNNGCGCS